MSTRKRELGRGERVVPGVWRLRLPLPWPGVPHCNAWAVAAADGIVLFDTGMHEPGSLAQLERALAMVNLRIEHVRLVVCTHAHSHVCLFQSERRLLISGDHLLGRVSLYYDYGYTPDPAGEFLGSLDVVEALDARLCLPGHGRTFTDVQGHIEANRALVRERISAVLDVVTERGPITVFDAVPHVYGEPITPLNANWWMSETLCYLTHLEQLGRVERI